MFFKRKNKQTERKVNQATAIVIGNKRFKESKKQKLPEIKDNEKLPSAAEININCRLFELRRVMVMTEVEVFKEYGCRKKDRVFALKDLINKMQIRFDNDHGYGIRSV